MISDSMPALLFLLFQTLFHGTAGDANYQMPFCVGPPNPVPIKAPYSQNLQNGLNNLERTISSIVSSSKIPGLSANLIVGDDIIWSKGFGKKDLSNPNSGTPDGDTVFRIGSVTKVFTELQLLQVRDEGLVCLDDPLTKLLPDFRVRNPYPSRRGISLGQLAGHQSGLLKDPPCNWGIGDCNKTTEEMLDLIATQTLLFPPGTRQSYSNTGITLLARGLQTVTNISWEEAVTQSIFNPLKMYNTNSYYLPKFAKNFAIGYNNGVQAPRIELDWFRPTGNGVQSNPVLDSMSLRDWFQVIAVKNGVTLGISHPWETFGYGNYTLFTKNGGITGYAAEIGFFPELKIGFTILESTGTDPAFAQTWLTLANFLLNVVEPEIWSLQPAPILPNDVDTFAGTYTNNLGDKLTITVGPYGSLNHKTLRLLGWGSTPNLLLDSLSINDLFQMSLRGIGYACIIPPGGDLATVQFLRNSTGHIVRFDVIGNLFYDSWEQQQFWKDGVSHTTPVTTKPPQTYSPRSYVGQSEGMKSQKAGLLSTEKQGLLRP